MNDGKPIFRTESAFAQARRPLDSRLRGNDGFVAGHVTDGLKRLMTSGLAPQATAYIIDSGVEGGEMMSVHFQKCFQDSGWIFAIFDSDDDAAKWLTAMLE